MEILTNDEIKKLLFKAIGAYADKQMDRESNMDENYLYFLYDGAKMSSPFISPDYLRDFTTFEQAIEQYGLSNVLMYSINAINNILTNSDEMELKEF